MYLNQNPHYQRLLVEDRHAELRREAGASRLRRQARHARRRERAGPRR